MIVSDLLDELRENILHDRSDRVAGTPDLLWSDTALVRYINEAQRRFARRGLVIRDGTTTAVTRVTLATGVAEYALHPSVLAVISAKVTGDSMDMSRAGHTAFDAYRAPDPLFFDPSNLTALAPGKPVAFSTDEFLSFDENASSGLVTMRMYPVPTVAWNGVVVQLRVIRLPVAALTCDDLEASPEIPEDHHLEMLDWAAYLALRIVDVDAGWNARALEFRSSFEQHVLQARQDVMRKLFTPLQWGFGRNGFRWER